ncbi:MAG: KGK domain-containing protein [Crinalium sp.]
MENNFLLKNCEDEDALLLSDRGLKAGTLRQKITDIFQTKFEGLLTEELKSQGIEIRTQEFSSISLSHYIAKKWFGNGIDGEILKIGGKGWKKGKMKIRVSLEFCPDEPEVTETLENNQPETNQPESPLDDLRRMINEQT